MLPNELPEIINPLNYCRKIRQEATLSGKISVSRLANFGLAQPQDRSFDMRLTFSIDEKGFCKIEGVIQGALTLTCQRCLQAFEYQFKQPICVSPVASLDEARHLPDCYEPLLLDGEVVHLSEWVAEEIHLALPITPKHEEDCQRVYHKPDPSDQQTVQAAKSEERVFPFKDLKRVLSKS